MRPGDADAVSELADICIGPGYYPPQTVREYLTRSTTDQRCLAYVADAGPSIVAFRFVLPPGRWSHGRGDGLSEDRWPGPKARAAYFQSCFVHPDAMGQGLGKQLAKLAFDDLAAIDTDFIVAHSWKESPHDSSQRYLRALGFEAVAEHPDYWMNIDYVCKRDGKPCRCTAIEMVKRLS